MYKTGWSLPDCDGESLLEVRALQCALLAHGSLQGLKRLSALVSALNVVELVRLC